MSGYWCLCLQVSLCFSVTRFLSVFCSVSVFIFLVLVCVWGGVSLYLQFFLCGSLFLSLPGRGHLCLSVYICLCFPFLCTSSYESPPVFPLPLGLCLALSPWVSDSVCPCLCVSVFGPWSRHLCAAPRGDPALLLMCAVALGEPGPQFSRLSHT